ncbi:MAG: transposase [Sphingomonadales bacterium]|nr:transposase [Sphingomonadales bacterium]
MSRVARIVVPDCPHHVIQRGVRRMETFFGASDYRAYLDLLATHCANAGVQIWAYCLMPNHVHLILVPDSEDGLAKAMSAVHRRYATRINRREDWSGHLWQERFHSFSMDERHLLIAARYVELNPVRGNLVGRPQDWQWSSAAAHLKGRSDGVVAVEPLLKRVPDWRRFLDQGISEQEAEAAIKHVRLGRPQGSKAFLDGLEKQLGRSLRPKKRGPKPASSQ